MKTKNVIKRKIDLVLSQQKITSYDSGVIDALRWVLDEYDNKKGR